MRVGLELEAAAQLADADYARVTVTARTEDKAETARTELQARGSVDVFDMLTLDLDDVASVATATDDLVERGNQIDVLLLNAGVEAMISRVYRHRLRRVSRLHPADEWDDGH